MDALRLAEARLQAALNWVNRFHGKLPGSLRLELQRAENGEIISPVDPSTNRRNSNKTTTIQKSASTGESEVHEDGEGQNDEHGDGEHEDEEDQTEDDLDDLEEQDEDWETDTPITPAEESPPETPNSSAAASPEGDDSDTADPKMKVVDISCVEVKQEPLDPDEHVCHHCEASFESAQALSVHSLVHAKLRLSRMGISQKNLKLVKRQPRLYSIRRRIKKESVAPEITEKPKRTRARTTRPSTAKTKSKTKTTEKIPRASKKSKYAAKKPKKLECELCPRRFFSENSLNLHMTSVHKCTKPCDSCGIRFTTTKERNTHMRDAHPELNCHKCTVCGSNFLFEEFLSNHMTNVHPDPNQATTCEVCGKFCKTRQMLKQHLERNHVDPSLAVPCPTCGVQVKSARLLKSHMRTHIERAFLCQVCGYAGRTKPLLDRHMTGVHGTKRPFNCPHCTLTFKTKTDLSTHMDRHFGKNLKACLYCGIEKVPKDLSNHINIVHKGRKFKCAQCTAMFSLRAHLKNHYTLKHPTVPIPPDDKIEVIYTKTPEDTISLAPPPAKKTRTAPAAKPREVPHDGLTCITCPRAVFHTRDDLDLHMLRHQKDPDYKLQHRLPVHRLDLEQPHSPSASSNSATTHSSPEQLPPHLPEEPLNQHHQMPTQFPQQPPPGGNLNASQYLPYNPFFQLQPHLAEMYGGFPPYSGGMLPDQGSGQGHQGSRY